MKGTILEANNGCKYMIVEEFAGWKEQPVYQYRVINISNGILIDDMVSVNYETHDKARLIKYLEEIEEITIINK